MTEQGTGKRRYEPLGPLASEAPDTSKGVLRSTLLGSVSHTLASLTGRPILIAPEHPAGND
jgi:hypothetical protein